MGNMLLTSKELESLGEDPITSTYNIDRKMEKVLMTREQREAERAQEEAKKQADKEAAQKAASNSGIQIMGDDGVSYGYVPNAQIDIQDGFTQKVISILNTIYKKKRGKSVINTLLDKHISFMIINKFPVINGQEYGDTMSYFDGVIKAGMISIEKWGEKSILNDVKIRSLAHEIFHRYQELPSFNEVGREVYIEISAVLFETSIGGLMVGVENKLTAEGKIYAENFTNLYCCQTFDEEAEKYFNILIDNFFKGSSLNVSGVYEKTGYKTSKLPLPDSKKLAISTLFPL